MPRVFIADKLESAGVDALSAAGIEVDNRPGLKDDALREALRAADAVVVAAPPRSPPTCWPIRAN
jgi:D-3-phosphoglycerate dehydrogenase / 2-oxoglutarate reductase